MKSTLVLCYVILSSLCAFGTTSHLNDSCVSPCPPRIAVKTNMLYDAALIPNIGVEVSFGNSYSVIANWEYAWWSKNEKHRFYRVYGGDIEVRRWFHDDSHPFLSGHHLGLYYQMATYDFEFGGKGIQSDFWNYGVGIAYGYSLPLNSHFNIDFSLGIGYLWGKYKKYHPADGCYVWDNTSKRKWFGPTKAEISIVYIIGGNRHKKGGNR